MEIKEEGKGGGRKARNEGKGKPRNHEVLYGHLIARSLIRIAPHATGVYVRFDISRPDPTRDPHSEP